MRTRTFELPIENLEDFFTRLNQTSLNGRLIEVDEDEELVVAVEYDEDQREEMMLLIEAVEEDLYGEEE